MKKILIVEDEPSYQNLLHKELTAKGYAVVDAKDGKEGYDTALAINPDLIILDILMQGVDGLTMLEQLRNDDKGKSMKVILLTNIGLDDQIMERALNTKPLYYFVKSDITMAALVAKVEDEFADQETDELFEAERDNKSIF